MNAETVEKLQEVYETTLIHNAALFAACWREEEMGEFVAQVSNHLMGMSPDAIHYLPFIFSKLDGIVWPDHWQELESWGQVLHAICQATIERDLLKAVTEYIEEEKNVTPDKIDMLFDAGFIQSNQDVWVKDDCELTFQEAWRAANF